MKKHSGWSIHFKQCLGCGTTTKKHAGHGYCTSCYEKVSPSYILKKKARNIKKEKLYQAYLQLQAVKETITSIPGTQYPRVYYEANKEELRRKATERSRQRKEENTKQIAEYLQTHPCVDCGETDIIVLHFDHIENKSFGIGDRMTLKWETLLTEIQKCVVRCANCHMRRTAIQQNWTKLKFSQKILETS